VDVLNPQNLISIIVYDEPRMLSRLPSPPPVSFLSCPCSTFKVSMCQAEGYEIRAVCKSLRDAFDRRAGLDRGQLSAAVQSTTALDAGKQKKATADVNVTSDEKQEEQEQEQEKAVTAPPAPPSRNRGRVGDARLHLSAASFEKAVHAANRQVWGSTSHDTFVSCLSKTSLIMMYCSPLTISHDASE
jgi:hypothetical protein